MKVTIISPVYGKNLGIGMNRYITSIIACLRKNKHEVNCVAFAKGDSKSRIKKWGSKIFPGSAIKEFMKSARNDSDIYHFICPELMYYPFAVLFLFYIKKVLKKKIVLTFHDMMTLHSWEGKASTDFIVKPLILRLVALSDLIIANSEQTARELRAYLHVSPSKITAIPLGVDKRFAPLKASSKKGGKFKIGYLSAFDSVKDPLFALECYKELSKKYPQKFSFDMWGRGKLTETCAEFIRANNLKDAKINGFVPEKEIVKTYNSFDAYLFTSRYEGFGLNILEAMACGVPVIVRKDSKIPNELKKYCIAGDSKSDIGKKIYKLCTDSSLRNKAIREGIKLSKKLTWEKNANKHLEVYKKLA